MTDLSDFLPQRVKIVYLSLPLLGIVVKIGLPRLLSILLFLCRLLRVLDRIDIVAVVLLGLELAPEVIVGLRGGNDVVDVFGAVGKRGLDVVRPVLIKQRFVFVEKLGDRLILRRIGVRVLGDMVKPL